jgi:beta-N-acetylhexosaminidase
MRFAAIVGNRSQQRLLLLVAVLLASGIVAASPADEGALVAGHDEAVAWARERLPGLTLERKVAQMIVAPIHGEYRAADASDLQDWLRLAGEDGIGGFVVYGGSPLETAHLLNRLQREAELPLLIAADFEGGPGQQLAGATEFPANMALAAIGSEDLAHRVGTVGAREGRAVGIHLTYSPVVDVQTRPENPVLSVRSFGGDLDLLGRLAAAYIRGYQEGGMLATAKHYPGRGDVELIPGTDFTVNKKSKERVIAEDLEAFRRASQAGVAFVMSEHIAVPSLTGGSDAPASVEKELATHWLREELGFEGVLTTDDLWYRKVTDRFGAERVGVLAIQAGHDALLKPADPRATIRAVVAAVRAGEIPEARIDASVEKLLYWKARLNLHRVRLVDTDRIPGVVGVAEHLQLVKRIAEESLTLLRNQGFLPTTAGKLGSVLHVSIQRKENDAAPAAVAARLKAAFPVKETIAIGPGTDPALRDRAANAAAGVDTVVVSLFSQRKVYVDNGALGPEDRSLIERLSAVKPRSTVVMSYGNPYLAPAAEKAAVFLTGYGEGGFYGNQLAYADAFVRLLKGEIVPRGKLPVSVSRGLPIGAGLTY